jgi:hypothetical protein
MKLKSSLRVKFRDRKTLRAVAIALTPDNINFPRGMSFSQRTLGNELSITISFDSTTGGHFETLISTLDEIISHTYSAVSSIEKTEKL